MDTHSEEFRLECEARFVLKMPKKESRTAYMADVRKKRGDSGHDYLARRVMEMHSAANKAEKLRLVVDNEVKEQQKSVRASPEAVATAMDAWKALQSKRSR